MIYPLSDPQPYLTNSSFAIKDANSDFLPGTIDPKDLVISALCSGLPEVYACLLDAGLDINHRLPGSPAAPAQLSLRPQKYADVPLIRFLLSRGGGPNDSASWGGPPYLRSLALAAGSVKAGGPEAVRVLQGEGAEWRGSGAVQVAAAKGRVECLRALVRGGSGCW